MTTGTRIAVTVLALGIFVCTAAQARTTAGGVKDPESLKAFVEGAKAYIESITEMNEGAKLRQRLRTEGEWKSGSTFLVVFLKSGEPFIHGNDRAAESKNLLGVEDERGTKVVKELIGGARREGRKFLRYHYDNPVIQGDEETGSPKFGYAVSFPGPNTKQRLVIGSGIYVSQ